MKVLVLGAAGLLGNAMFRVLSENATGDVYGTVRSTEVKKFFAPQLGERLVLTEDLENHDHLVRLFDTIQPEIVVNCTALGKMVSPDPLRSISIYALLPHRLAHLCRVGNVRLVHISSDGVFSGARGGYTENDFADARDLYGVSKILGEVREPHTITLRTSIIGHELQTRSGLLEWFLAQQGQCRCYARAIFSGFPTVVLAQIVRDVVLQRPALSGVYHVATKPISKCELLSLVAQQYKKAITIVPDDKVVVDRSLNADRFRAATGYVPPGWSELVRRMHSYQFGLARE
jgi:dTDP-4-dehydrorhamnose reductase